MALVTRVNTFPTRETRSRVTKLFKNTESKLPLKRETKLLLSHVLIGPVGQRHRLLYLVHLCGGLDHGSHISSYGSCRSWVRDLVREQTGYLGAGETRSNQVTTQA